jgi:putative membrane-bound dehydrogenase-like protein
MRPFIALAVVLLAQLSIAYGQAPEVVPHHQDRPPGPALSPQEAIAAMTVPEGFLVEVVASEPDIVNPVAMTFDERGRIWVTESLEYPRKQPGRGKDRVKVLEDTDADGRADKFSVFTEGLNIPSGIAVGYGGVWVANSPDILFYPDADRDAKPDGPPQTIVTGFGRSDTHELPNSLTWGPDGDLYGLNGVFNHSHVKYAKENPNFKEDHPGWQFTCAMFRIHPVTREFEIFCEGTSNPWGIAFDHEGSAFVSACVIDHLWHLVRTGYYHRQGGPYPPFTWKIDSIVKHTHQKAAYCGLEYYDSDAYPEQYRNKLYMGNIHGGCINVDKLQRDGSTYFATGEPDFLTANDAWFMPVSQKTGPDGCLYILDWYDRYHCYQDANRDSAGIDRLKGRLYRVRYKDTPRAKAFDLAKESDEKLFERLNSSNGFFRDVAMRLLIERRMQGGRDVADAIVRRARQVIFNEKQQINNRLRATWVVLALQIPDEPALPPGPVTNRIVNGPTDIIGKLLGVREPSLRAWTFRCLANSGKNGPYWGGSSAKEPDVQLQLAIAMANAKGVERDHRVFGLGLLLLNCGDDKLIPHVVWQNVHPLLEEKPDAFVSVFESSGADEAPALALIAPRLMERILARKNFNAAPAASLYSNLAFHTAWIPVARECLTLVANRVQSGEIRGQHLTQLRDAFAAALDRLLGHAAQEPFKVLDHGKLAVLDVTTRHALTTDAAILAVSWKDSRGVELVRRTFADGGAGSALRLRALSALIAADDKKVLDLVAGALSDQNLSKEFSGQLLAALGKLDEPRVGVVVLKAYSSLAAEVQPRAIELLTQRTIWAKPLVEAIGAGKIPASALNVNQVQRLLALKDNELTAAVQKYWGSIRTTRDPAREKLVAEMRKLIRTTPGDAHRGIEVFNRVCGQCHKIYGQGQEVGPDLTGNGRASLEQLLSNVFDPSLVIGAIYQPRVVQVADGRIVTGLLVEDSPQRVVLKVQGGKQETIAREDIEAMKVSELSLMPEGLEKQLKPQEIADLFAFISLDKHPDDPAAKPIPAGEPGKK